MRGWTASYSVHFGFLRPVLPVDVERCSDWAAALDVGSTYVPGGVSQFRAIMSKLDKVVSSVAGPPPQLQNVLLLGDAVGHGGDSFPPFLSAGQSIQVEWITGERGRGVNGRTYFPYFGSSVQDFYFKDVMATDAAGAVEAAAEIWASASSLETGGESVVRKSVRAGAPVSPLTSQKVIGVTVRHDFFMHQRRRVQYLRPFDASP